MTQVNNVQKKLNFKYIFLGKGLTIAVFILVGNWPYNIEVSMIWVSVDRMSSRHSCRREVVMGSKELQVFWSFLL